MQLANTTTPSPDLNSTATTVLNIATQVSTGGVATIVSSETNTTTATTIESITTTSIELNATIAATTEPITIPLLTATRTGLTTTAVITALELTNTSLAATAQITAAAAAAAAPAAAAAMTANTIKTNTTKTESKPTLVIAIEPASTTTVSNELATTNLSQPTSLSVNRMNTTESPSFTTPTSQTVAHRVMTPATTLTNTTSYATEPQKTTTQSLTTILRTTDFIPIPLDTTTVSAAGRLTQAMNTTEPSTIKVAASQSGPTAIMTTTSPSATPIKGVITTTNAAKTTAASIMTGTTTRERPNTTKIKITIAPGITLQTAAQTSKAMLPTEGVRRDLTMTRTKSLSGVTGYQGWSNFSKVTPSNKRTSSKIDQSADDEEKDYGPIVFVLVAIVMILVFMGVMMMPLVQDKSPKAIPDEEDTLTTAIFLGTGVPSTPPQSTPVERNRKRNSFANSARKPRLGSLRRYQDGTMELPSMGSFLPRILSTLTDSSM